MDNYLLLGAGRRPKSGPNDGPTQREVLAGRIAPRPVGPAFVTAPPVPVERPGTVRITGTARAVVTNGAQRGAAMFEGPKNCVPAPNSSEGARAKREQYSRLMPELKAQLQTERFDLRKVGTDLVAPRCKEGPGSGSLGSKPDGCEPSGFVRQESDGDLRGIVETLVGVVSGLVAGMAGSKEALGDGCGLEPVGTGREPWLSTPIDRSSSGFGTMNASGRPVFDFDFRTPTSRFDDSLEPKLESGRRSALKVPRVDVEAVPRYSADNDEEPFYPRRGKSKVRPDDSDGGSQAGLRGTREPAGTRKCAPDTVWPVRRSGGSRRERSRSSSRESVP